MCRDNDHGGRRCPHDTADARQSRRIRARVRAELGDALPPQALNYTRSKVALVEPVAPLSPLTAAQGALAAYRETATHMSDDMPQQRWDAPLNSAEIDAETKLIDLGATVAALAEKYDMPSAAEFAASEEALSARKQVAMAQLDAMKAELAPWKKIINESRVPSKWAQQAEAIARHNEIVKRCNALARKIGREAEIGGNAEYAGLIQRRNAAYRQALTAVGVEFASADDITYNLNGSLPKLRRIIGEAAAFYPKAWLSNARAKDRAGRGTLSIEQDGQRPGYFSTMNSMHVRSADLETVTHEIGHYLESANAQIGEAERAFLNRRSGLLAHQRDGERRPARYGLSARSSREQGYADNFPSSYSGRIYELGPKDTYHRGYYEILTVGMEGVFFGSHGGYVGYAGRKPDTEYTHFILGLLASSSTRRIA